MVSASCRSSSTTSILSTPSPPQNTDIRLENSVGRCSRGLFPPRIPLERSLRPTDLAPRPDAKAPGTVKSRTPLAPQLLKFLRAVEDVRTDLLDHVQPVAPRRSDIVRVIPDRSTAS